MTEDRRHLIEHVWRTMYTRTCRCGRCDCASSDPFQIARNGLWQWSMEYRRLSATMAHSAEGFRAIAEKFERRSRAIAKKYGRPVDYGDGSSRAMAAERERTAKRFAHAAVLFERLSRGQHPFRQEVA